MRRVVLDTNVLLRGLLSTPSASGRILDAFERRRFVLLLSLPVLSEYFEVLTDASIVQRYPILTPGRVDLALRRLRYFADVIRRVQARFELPRDPKDAKMIEAVSTASAER